MKKNFVFDTNVLLVDPHAILKFGDNNVVIPITVIEEIDKFKRDASAVGRSARETSRLIDRYRSEGSLSKGVPLENGGTLRIVTDLGREPPLPFPTLGKTADSLILAAALLLKKREQLPVVFVTRDINLRVRADAVGLKAVNYEEESAGETVEEFYSGRVEIEAADQLVRALEEGGSIDAGEFELLPNQCVKLVNEKDREHCAFGRYRAQENAVVPIVSEDEDIGGIRARNIEQRFAVDLLLDNSVKLLTLAGKAGTGKTLLAIAAGIKTVQEERAYAKLVVARPILPMGKDLGYLPGEIGEKIMPWMQPVFDNLALITHSQTGSLDDEPKGKSRKRSRKRPVSQNVQQLIDMGVLEVEALSYIRGRSLPQQFIVIDEAQNLTGHEVKTVITRAGENSKVVLTGDYYQIDNPFLDSHTNGLTMVINRFKTQEIAGHITLEKGERSKLAELASNIL